MEEILVAIGYSACHTLADIADMGCPNMQERDLGIYILMFAMLALTAILLSSADNSRKSSPFDKGHGGSKKPRIRY